MTQDALFGGNTAVFSECGRYRYRLERELDGDGPRALFVMLNPSTADAQLDDQTIRRCKGFAKSWGCSGLTVVNLFAFRATEPRALFVEGWPIGEPEPGGFIDRNDCEIAMAARECDLRIAAWGAHVHPLFPGRARDVWRIVTGIPTGAAPRLPMHALKVTADGHPGHPLYVKGDTELQPWEPA